MEEDRLNKFKFDDDKLNQKLISLLEQEDVPHQVENGVVLYSDESVQKVENELVRAVRDSVFPDWQVLSCPQGSVRRYEAYMDKNSIPYVREWHDGITCFLLPGDQEPLDWDINDLV